MMDFEKFVHSDVAEYDFCVLIPTWNNLPFLRNCLDSLSKHSTLKIQPIVIANEGKDGTVDWLQSVQKIDYIHAKRNMGICYALNIARSLAKADYIVYSNDDMYFLPDWDVKMMQEIKQLDHHYFMLSATMIEPEETGNPCVSIANYGRDLDSFDEKKLVSTFHTHHKEDWKGSTWPPNVVHKDIWDLVGGLSIEYSPGMYSDPDFSMKLYQAGVRHFKGIGNSMVYHFGSKSTKRIRKNKGRSTFILKWGMTANYFMNKILNIGKPWFQDVQKHKLSAWDKGILKIKRMLAALSQ